MIYHGASEIIYPFPVLVTTITLLPTFEFEMKLQTNIWMTLMMRTTLKYCGKYESNIRNVLDPMCPLKQINAKNMDPWISDDLMDEIKEKDLLLKKRQTIKLHQ